MNFSPDEIPLYSAYIAFAMARNLTTQELRDLSAFLTALTADLYFIAATRDNEGKKKKENPFWTLPGFP